MIIIKILFKKCILASTTTSTHFDLLGKIHPIYII